MRLSSLLLFVCSLLFMAVASADPRHDQDIEVNVQFMGERVIVDLSLTVPATRRQVWDVLTDFEHMAGFISNLKESKVIGSSDGVVNIFQRGFAQHALVGFSFESTREIRLAPYDKIQSHLISGNMSKMDGTTLLLDDGAQTRIIYHTDSIPGVWIPPLLGKGFIEHEIREQFQEMRDEIIRRRQSANPSHY